MVGKMFENEKQFEELVKKLNLDDSIDSSHKERLRVKVIDAHKAKSRFGLVKIVLSVAAAVLIGFVIGRISFYTPQPKMPGRPVASFDYAQDKPVQRDGQQIQYAKVDTVESEDIFDSEIQKAQISETLQTIRTLAEAKDVEALTTILRGSDTTAKLFAAKYLAEILETTPAEILKKYSTISKAITKEDEPFKEPGKKEKPPICKSGAKDVPGRPSTLIICIDKKTNEPIADANIWIHLAGKNIAGVTDVNGIYKMAIPSGDIRKFLATVEADGYSPMKLSRYASGVSGKIIFDDEIFFDMNPAIDVGGTITDSQGNPIENVRIRIRVNIDEINKKGIPFVDMDSENQTTDANGFWFCDFFPEDGNDVGLLVEHPNFVFYDGYPLLSR